MSLVFGCGSRGKTARSTSVKPVFECKIEGWEPPKMLVTCYGWNINDRIMLVVNPASKWEQVSPHLAKLEREHGEYEIWYRWSDVHSVPRTLVGKVRAENANQLMENLARWLSENYDKINSLREKIEHTRRVEATIREALRKKP